MRLLVAGPVLTALVAVTLSLAGCQGQPRGVTIPPGSEDLPPCSFAQVSIDELAAMGAPGCDLTGTSLTFAEDMSMFAAGPPAAGGGTPTLTVPSVGAVFSQGGGDGRELLIVNWGVPGVGVAAIEDGRLIEIWASSDAALELQRQQLAVENVEFD